MIRRQARRDYNQGLLSGEMSAGLRSTPAFDVAKLRSDRCVVRDPIDLVPCEAMLAIMIDGQETIETVYLRNGMSGHDQYVAFF